MRILFDHGVPVPLRRHPPDHSTDTAAERGWERLSNGDLLDRVAAEGYELLTTTDQSLRFQQNLTERPLGVIVLMTTAWPRIEQHVPDIRAAIDVAVAGSAVEVNM